MEILTSVWTWIAASLGGVTLAGIISAIIYGCLKGAFNRTIAKINFKKISEEATEKGILKIKDVSFKHSIQPIVEGELKKINEYAVEVLKTELNEVKKQYSNVVNILEKFAQYFDNSIGVSEQSKQELRDAIASAKIKAPADENVEVEEVIIEEVKTPTKSTKTEKEGNSTSTVDR